MLVLIAHSLISLVCKLLGFRMYIVQNTWYVGARKMLDYAWIEVAVTGGPVIPLNSNESNNNHSNDSQNKENVPNEKVEL